MSPVATEKALQLLSVASYQVLSRGQETLTGTPRVLRCWVRSWTQSFSPYPFSLPSSPTIRKYGRIWISGLCYFIRLHLLARRLNKSTRHLCGFELSEPQKDAIDGVWSRLLELAGSHLECSQSVTIPDDCLELLFQLFVTFWTEIPGDGNLEVTAIAHFSGILGLHPVEHAFRRAYEYTPFLSALIWVGRLVLLEYALPLRPYNHLPVRWPGRQEYSDLGSRLCGQIRPKYLQRGSLSPIGYLIERLQHGRAIAKREGPRTNISWSADGQTLSIDQSTITIPQFRLVVHNAVTRAQQQLEDLLFGWWPDIDLHNIQDDLSNRCPGYCFVTDPTNHLQSSFRVLSRRAFSPARPLSLKGAGRQREYAYLQGRDRLVQLLFGTIQLSSGMPARGEELRLIRWANTPAAARNIFVYDGKIILVFSYNKASTNYNNSFYVVRRSCPAVERILFVYLAYVRPFADFLYRELQEDYRTGQNRHLFTRHDWDSACFNSDACLRSLQKSTNDSPILLTMRNYRHIAIAMSKRHIPNLLKPSDPHAPQDYDGFLRLLAFQTGHKPATHANAYALETAFPAKLQPDLIRRYLENSRVWHDFLLVGESDIVEAVVDHRYSRSKKSFQSAGYFPDPPIDLQGNNKENEGRDWPASESESESASNYESEDRNTKNRRQVSLRRNKSKRELDVLCEKDMNISPVFKKIRRLEEQIKSLTRQRGRERR